MDPKSTLVKSKSSHSGMSKSREGRRTQRDKMSRSNAALPQSGVKKRGVYVEKRLTRPNLANGKKDDSTAKTAQSRSRPGKKKFVTSALTILSKSAAGTQCPEVEDVTRLDVDNSENNKGIQNHDARQNKEKLKSKVLSKKYVREDRKKMVVLQSKREIAQTPSNYSEWSCRDASQNSNTSNCLPSGGADENNDDEHLNIANDLKNAIMEGRTVKKVKKLRYLGDEPSTLVADPPNVQKNLYNFFVDLLETTISVYNVQAEYDSTEPVEASETELQIKGSVANELNIDTAKGKALNKTRDVIRNPQHEDIQNNCNNNYEYINMEAKPLPIKHSRDEARCKKNTLKKIKAESFIHANKAKIPEKSKSIEINRKTKFKNKKDLIKALKQELEIDAHVFEEPQSIFQALKIMARNKKKISFAPKTYTDECVLMRRKVIPSRKGKKNKNSHNIFGRAKSIFNTTDYKHENKKKHRDGAKIFYSETDSLGSSHSLEVYGLDYDQKGPTTTCWNKQKDVMLTYHSPNSDFDFDINDVILNPTATNSSIGI